MGHGVIQVVRAAHVHYQVPDLDEAHAFLMDFGFVEAQRHEHKIFYRGFGVQPYLYVLEQAPDRTSRFLGGAWVAATEADFRHAASHPDAGAVCENDGPGRGQIVTITDPNGMAVSFVYGQTLREAADGDVDVGVDGSERHDRTVGQMKPPNFAREKARRNVFQRFDPGPSPVHKLGHYGFVVPKSRFARTVAWYLELLNLRITDAVYDPKTMQDETCFFRIDLGDEYSDHHSFFLAAGPEDRPTHIHHSSFEVNDFDTECLGHDWLRSRGWQNCWGIGRHVLGSQIFDYWFDAAGFVLEHYSDGDLLNARVPFRREPAAPGTLYVWGPNVPLDFITGHVDRLAESALAKVAAARGRATAPKALKVPDPYESAASKPRVEAGGVGGQSDLHTGRRTEVTG